MKNRLYSGDSNNQALRSTLNHHERKIISEILQNSPSIRRAAKTLGISHTALLNKMKKHGMKMET